MTNELNAFYLALDARLQAINSAEGVPQHVLDSLDNLVACTYGMLSKEEKQLISMVCNADVHDIIF